MPPPPESLDDEPLTESEGPAASAASLGDETEPLSEGPHPPGSAIAIAGATVPAANAAVAIAAIERRRQDCSLISRTRASSSARERLRWINFIEPPVFGPLHPCTRRDTTKHAPIGAGEPPNTEQREKWCSQLVGAIAKRLETPATDLGTPDVFLRLPQRTLEQHASTAHRALGRRRTADREHR